MSQVKQLRPPTPGPWVKLPRDKYGIEVRSVSIDEFVCNLRNEADAQLISAAPDLLNVCTVLLNDFKWQGIPEDHGYIVLLKAVLAKAKGEAA